MKKKLILALMAALTIATVGCGKTEPKPDNNTGTNVETNDTPLDVTPDDNNDMNGTNNEANSNADGNQNANQNAGDMSEAESVGKMMLTRFEAIVNEDSALSAEDIANKLIEDDSLPFGAGVMPVQEGLLTGFDNYEVKGFKEGAFFAPMIGSIPFAGYVFTLDEGADTEAFIQNLESNANLRWNICTEADEMVSGHVETKVFFLMCPATFEEEPMDEF